MAVQPSAALRLVVEAIFAALRVYAIVALAGYLLLWDDWYRHHPVALAAAGLTAGWSAAFAVLARRRGIGWPLATVNVGAAVLLGAGATWWLPPDGVGDTASWVFLAATHATAVSAWVFTGPRLLAAVGLTGAAFAVGAWPGQSPPLAAAVLIVAVGLIVRHVLSRLATLAGDAEARLLELERCRHAERGDLARSRARRERERALHDSVLNTLTGIAWGGGDDRPLARRRCAESAAALEWLLTAPEPPGDGVAGDAAGDATPPGAVVAPPRHEYLGAVRRLIGNLALGWTLPLGALIVRDRPVLGSVPLSGLLWMVTVVIVIAVRRRFRTGPLSRSTAVGVNILCVLIAVVGAMNVDSRGSASLLNWPLIGLPVLLALVTVSRPAREWMMGAAAITLAMTAVSLAGNQTDAHSLSRLAVALYFGVMPQICLMLLGPLLWNVAGATARAARGTRDLRDRARRRDRRRADRDRSLRLVADDVLPLLGDVAAGRLDPGAEPVRYHCARRAMAIRRVLIGDEATPVGLGLVIRAAESRGTVVETQIQGSLDDVPGPVRGELAAHLRDVLAAVEGCRVLLTMTAGPSTGSLFASCPWPADRLPPVPVGSAVDVTVEAEDGWLCLELRWPHDAGRVVIV